jgi:hypothetical protein
MVAPGLKLIADSSCQLVLMTEIMLRVIQLFALGSVRTC